jgi:hypothetical protein
MTHTHTHSRTLLNDGTAHCKKNLYLTIHNTHKRQASMLPVEFEPVISARDWLQTLVFLLVIEWNIFSWTLSHSCNISFANRTHFTHDLISDSYVPGRLVALHLILHTCYITLAKRKRIYICLLVVYLTTASVNQKIQRRMFEWQRKDFERSNRGIL